MRPWEEFEKTKKRPLMERVIEQGTIVATGLLIAAFITFFLYGMFR